MGFIDDIKAINAIACIKSGGTAKLSISQIACLITNMPDAKKNLSSEKFNDVKLLFNEFRKCNTKLEMDVYEYLETAKKIILQFDAIAPYEKYGGGNEVEYSFMLEDMRKEASQQNTIYATKTKDIFLTEEDQEYIDLIVKESTGNINQEDAKDFIKILYSSMNYGKSEALMDFDNLYDKFVAKYNYYNVMIKVYFLSGLLYSNNILTKEESDEISKKYSDRVKELMMKSEKFGTGNDHD